jgi:ribosomal protein S18 acetylase RimI-like enzyme
MTTDAITYTEQTASLAQIYTHLCACSPDFIPPLHERVSIDEYAKKLHAHAVTLEAWSGGVLVGLVATYLNPEAGSGFVSNVSVMPALMRQGVARRLMADCLVRAASAGVGELSLQVGRQNLRAQRFYAALGFAMVQDMGEIVLMQWRGHGQAGAETKR